MLAFSELGPRDGDWVSAEIRNLGGIRGYNRNIYGYIGIKRD